MGGRQVRGQARRGQAGGEGGRPADTTGMQMRKGVADGCGAQGRHVLCVPLMTGRYLRGRHAGHAGQEGQAGT